MRIGIDVGKAVPPRDGIGTYTVELVRALAALPEEDELLLYPTHGPADPAAIAAALAPLPAGRCRVLDRPAPLPGEVDVFHVTTWTMPEGWRGPVVLTCYDLTFLTLPEHHTAHNRRHCLEGLLRALAAGARVVAISEATRRDLVERLGVDPAAVEVVHPAPPAGWRVPDPAVARGRVQTRYAVEVPYLLTLGTREPRKNLRRLVAAWSGLPEDQRRRAPLVVVGGSGWLHEVDAGAAAAAEAAGARFLGHVPEEDLPSLYAAAELFVFPSLAEGFGLPVAEAMACGTAVLTSATSALPEVAGGAAALVDPTDESALRAELARLLGDEAERRRLAEAGRRRAAELSWERAAAATRAVYAAAARDGAARGGAA